MAKEWFLVRVSFFNSGGVYTYYAHHRFAMGISVVVLTPSGELKVVKVMSSEPSSRAEILRLPFTVKPIKGVAVDVDVFIKGVINEQPKKLEDDSPV